MQTCPHFDPKKKSRVNVDTEMERPKSRPIVRNGTYRRKSDSRVVEKFYCRICEIYFSNATYAKAYRQKKRRLNPLLRKLFASSVSQRRSAIILGVNRKTVSRKFRFLSKLSQERHQKWLIEVVKPAEALEVHFDDLETSEHSKYKPVSVTLVVEKNTRKIIDFELSKMPPKWIHVQRAFQKYGARKDERPIGWHRLFHRLSKNLSSKTSFVSDQNPFYSRLVSKYFPNSFHFQVKGRDAALVGQGELKKIGFDPIFPINHTCAMLRANLNRLARRTWCTTKTMQGLEDHIWIYVDFHNRELTREIQKSSGPVGS